MFEKLNKFCFITDNSFMQAAIFEKKFDVKSRWNFCSKFIIFIVMLFFMKSGLFAQIYKEKAVASFYADDFHGKKTSNGEDFNMNDFTCANKFLPFNTYLKVTNLANNLNAIVRVNAVKLDMIKSGTAVVKIEILKLGADTALSRQTAQSACQIMERKTGKKFQIPSFEQFKSEKTTNAKNMEKVEKSESEKTQKKYPSGTFWDIQVGSFSNKENARTAAKKLKSKGFSNIVLRTKGEITRVVIKNIPANEINIMEEKLQKDGYSDYLVKKSSQK